MKDHKMPLVLPSIRFKDDNIWSDYTICPNDIHILKISYEVPMVHQTWTSLLNKLTPNLIAEVEKYRRWEDRQNTLLGKLLVSLGYTLMTGKKLNFDDYQRDGHQKPFIEDGNFEFNISHTGKTVVCAITNRNTELGIDIEEIKAIAIDGFQHVFHCNEWDAIKKYTYTPAFFKYWTRKEAFTKAIGKGIVIPLHKIDTTAHLIPYNDQVYYLETYIFKDYYCSLAFNNRACKVYWIEVEF